MEEKGEGTSFCLLFAPARKEVVSCVTSGGGMIGWNFSFFG